MSIASSLRPSVAAAALFVSTLGCLAATSPLPAADSPTTFAGSYLAARNADFTQDLKAAASYYRSAVAAQPDNAELAQRLLILSLATGALDQAFPLAAKLAARDPSNPAVRLALATQNVAAGKLDDALAELDRAGPADLATLTTSLASAWIEFGQGKTDAALKRIAALQGPTWYPVFVDLHTALINDAAGRTDAAVAAARRAYSDDSSALGSVVAYARILARAGKSDEAIAALTALGGDKPAHPQLRYLLADIKAGRKLAPVIADAKAGIAETLYGLGAAIGTDQGAELPAAYLQLAAYLDPQSSPISMALGDVYTSIHRCQDALTFYDRVPQSDRIRRNADLQTGLCLEDLDQSIQATRYFKRVLAANPDDVEATIDLGNNYRTLKRFADAAAMYTRAITLTGTTVAVPTNDALAAASAPPPAAPATPEPDAAAPAPASGADDAQSAPPAADAAPADQSGDDQATDDQNQGDPAMAEESAPPADAPEGAAKAPLSPQWRLFYYRGVSYEQSKRWADGEVDLKRALALNPGQASVLNYLGYSWVDRGQNLDLALQLIQKAVRLTPTDGYVVDSLGWAYYKVGRYDDAVKTMETAVQLSGGDATINDHLGDVYWTVGRKREAVFQWTYARDSSPDKDLLPKILEKLKHGLEVAPAAGAGDRSSIGIQRGEATTAAGLARDASANCATAADVAA